MKNNELLEQNIKLSLLVGIAYGGLMNLSFVEKKSDIIERLKRLLFQLEKGIDEIYYLPRHDENSDTT